MSDLSNLHKIVKLLSETYSPAATIHESDFQFTSNEIIYAITDLDNSVSKDELQQFFAIMSDCGYCYNAVAKDNELKFVWLLKSSIPAKSQA